MHFTKADCFLGIFGKFQKRVYRFKSNFAWFVIIQFFVIQTSNAICQPLECLHISEVAFNFCDSGVKQRKLWNISYAENIHSDVSVSHLEICNFGTPTFQKADKITFPNFFGSISSGAIPLCLSPHGETMLNKPTDNANDKSQNGNTNS